jgi:hypothetical protein
MAWWGKNGVSLAMFEEFSNIVDRVFSSLIADIEGILAKETRLSGNQTGCGWAVNRVRPKPVKRGCPKGSEWLRFGTRTGLSLQCSSIPFLAMFVPKKTFTPQAHSTQPVKSSSEKILGSSDDIEPEKIHA